MKYIVSQTFEGLGDPCRTQWDTREQAEAEAASLRECIAKMVAEWDVPVEREHSRTGWANEIETWNNMAKIAGVEYDDEDNLTADSPQTWGMTAAAWLADQAVTIEEEEEEETDLE
jgi:hypothetical protein